MKKAKGGSYLGKSAGTWERMLASRDPLRRRLGAYALGEIGPEASESIPRLVEALEDKESFVRVWAAGALAKVDVANPKPALEALRKAMADERYFVRSLAVWHLSRLSPDTRGLDKVLSDLEKLTRDSDHNVRVEAATALKRLQSHKQVTH